MVRMQSLRHLARQSLHKAIQVFIDGLSSKNFNERLECAKQLCDRFDLPKQTDNRHLVESRGVTQVMVFPFANPFPPMPEAEVVDVVDEAPDQGQEHSTAG